MTNNPDNPRDWADDMADKIIADVNTMSEDMARFIIAIELRLTRAKGERDGVQSIIGIVRESS